jgi:hypothetical protein
MAESHDDRKICFAAQPGDEVQSSFRNLKNETLDIADNLIFNQLRGITPKMVFQYIATGLIGMQAFRGGLASVALGVAIHYSIAVVWAAIFYAASRKFAILSRWPVLSGLVYGGVIYGFMNFIVLPFSGVPHTRSAVTIASRVNGVLALLFFIGLPISLLVRRYSSERTLLRKT